MSDKDLFPAEIKSNQTLDTQPIKAMKLFIWIDPFEVDYGDSLLYVVASTVEEAKQIAAKSPTYWFGRSEHHSDMGHLQLGEPTRIKDIPCGEWYAYLS